MVKEEIVTKTLQREVEAQTQMLTQTQTEVEAPTPTPKQMMEAYEEAKAPPAQVLVMDPVSGEERIEVQPQAR